jgi:hypothetical protein
MKYLALFLLTLIVGCSTVVPVTAKFPEAPSKGSMSICPQLEKLKDDSKLSDVAKTIANNYTLYNECAIKSDAWIEWYNVQKIIFENLK